jgi:hypothetical protein
MILPYILLSYLIGYFMLLDSLKANGHLIMMDIVMFVLSPFSIINFIFVKLASHFFDLDEVVYRNKDNKYR